MEEFQCWACAKAIDSGDNYCRYCGNGQRDRVAWYYHIGPILALTFFALGPFALPLIWKSPKLTRRSQWILSGIAIVYTAYLIYGVVMAIRLFSSTFSALKGALTM